MLRSKGDRLVGITNGIDTAHWNPATDSLIPTQYDATSWQQGKAANKLKLQQRFGLTQDAQLPLIGLIGRLADQKGWDLVIDVLRWHLEQNRPVQWAILGTGEVRITMHLRIWLRSIPIDWVWSLDFPINWHTGSKLPQMSLSCPVDMNRVA